MEIVVRIGRKAAPAVGFAMVVIIALSSLVNAFNCTRGRGEFADVCAQEIIRMMETKVPELHDNADFEQTLWDHLYLMSHKQLDIDWPFDVTAAEKLQEKPKAIPLPQEGMRLRHYGKLLEQLFEKLKTMPEGEERDALAFYTANQMKRNLMTWGHGSMSDEKVADDLARFTDGVIQLDLSTMKLDKVTAIEEPKAKKKKK